MSLIDKKSETSILQSKFKTWPTDHFRCFKAEHFEDYYPPEFKEESSKVLSMPNGPKKQMEKGKLVEKVFQWALTDPQRAQKEFNSCANEILDFLREIADKLA